LLVVVADDVDDGHRVRSRGVEEARQARHHRLDRLHRRAQLSEEALLVAEVVLDVDGDDAARPGATLSARVLSKSIAVGSVGTAPRPCQGVAGGPSVLDAAAWL
jgi:hypothetical protein